MSGVEERVTRLEKQVRIYRILTIAMVVILVLMLSWVCYGVWKLMGLQQLIDPPVRARGVTVIDETRQPRAALIGTSTGWTLEALEEEQVDSRAVVSRVAGEVPRGRARVTLDASGAVPVLILSDRNGRQVWRTP